jgi:LysR family glycine cleavage system transcriptional activator
MDTLPLHALRAFDAAGRHGSFKAAAAQLHVTPSAISHQIADLERYLGVRLFDRRAGNVRLTPSGEQLLSDIAAPFEQLRAASARLRIAGQPSTLRLSANPFFADEILVPALARFWVAFPQLTVHVESTEALSDPRDGHVDFCVRFAARSEPGLHCEWLYDVEAFIVANERADTLIDFPFHGSSAWTHWRQRGMRTPSAPHTLHVSSYNAALRASARGLGATVALGPTIQPWLTAGRVHRFDEQRLPIGAMHLVHRPMSPSQMVLESARNWWVTAIRDAAS